MSVTPIIADWNQSAISVIPHADLSSLNTMHLSCICDALMTFHTDASEKDIVKIMKDITAQQQPFMILSGGSNVILPPQLQTTVIRPLLQGIAKIDESATHVNIEVMAGENWHELVVYTVEQGWFGLENLALIPGLTGAAPVQNIGAYGVQLEDHLTHVRALHLPTLTWKTLDRAACEFDYRDSKFKQEAGDWLITKVGFRLHKDKLKVTVNYGDVANLASSLVVKNGTQDSSISPVEVMRAIISIRQSKLPDPKQLPNCGSFFKNPIIANKQFKQLQQDYPQMVGYPVDDDHTKVAAGWLIDNAGLKGGGIAPILTHTKQALVLVNHAIDSIVGSTTQQDVLATQQLIQNKVFELFGIVLEREPVWVE